MTPLPAETRERIERIADKHSKGWSNEGFLRRQISEALTQLAEEERRERWQPIETAPMDQKVLVTYFPACGKPPIMIAWFSTSELKHHCKPWKINHFKKLRWSPTHWQPFPPPPTS